MNYLFGIARPILSYGLYPATIFGSVALSAGMLSAGFGVGAVLSTNALLFAALCFVLERVAPETGRWRLDPGEARTDVLHALVSNTIPTALFRALFQTAIVGASAVVASWLGSPLWPVAWPLLAQFALALGIAELASYGIHRFLHARLWPLHAVHHASPRMYFLLSVRKHPLQAFITYGGRLSVLWVLGVPAEPLTLYLALTAAHSHVQHANLPLRTGPLGWLFATPELHRVHHAREGALLNANYGDVLIVWDVLFGTRHAPDASLSEPAPVGLPDFEIPQTYGAHWRLPFEWSRLEREALRRRAPLQEPA